MKIIVIIMMTILFLLQSNYLVFANERIPNMPKELDNDTGLELEIKLDKKNYFPDAPITVSYIFKNTGSSVVHLPGILFLDLTFIVIDKDVSERKKLETRTLPNDVSRATNIIGIMPGETYSGERVINKTFYKMPQKTGHYQLYTIYFNVTKKYKKIKLWTGKLKSNTVEFEIQ